MCGIAGCVVAPGQRPPLEALQRMAAAMAHRGPDDSGIEISGSVGLVCTRLAIVDPGPEGHQPMTGPDGRWLLAYNGEIFNHAELRQELPPAPYRGHTDTETLLHALDAWGDAAVERCNGLFAFAALDVAGGRLLLARDRFGKKPLYVTRHRGALWFASEISALLAAGVPRRADPDRLAYAAGVGFPPGTITPVEGIDRVAPGSIVSVDLDTLRTSERRWYDPAEAVDPELGAELATLSRDALRQRLEEELRAAVRRRLMADVPVGTMCSGGIDSSLITAFASQEHPSLTAFTVSLKDEPDADETAWAQRVTRSLGIPLEVVEMGAADWRAALVPSVKHFEYPMAMTSPLPISRIAARAHEAGVKVLLTGEAADELFGGYPYAHKAEYRGFMTAGLRIRQAADSLRGGPGLRRLAQRRRNVPGFARHIAGRRRRTAPELAPEGVLEDFKRQLSEQSERAYSHHSEPRRRLEAALLGELSILPLPHLLNRMDKNAMQHSVETRVPFLDPDLVRLVVNLPLEHRAFPRPKGILRELAREHLPSSIARRPKQRGFVFDPRQRIIEAADRDFLEGGCLRELLGVATDPWRDLISVATGPLALRLWTGEIWCRLFLEDHSVDRVEADLWIAP